MNDSSLSRIDLISWILLIFLAILWGGSFFLAEVALDQVSPIMIALHRVFWASIILLIIIKVKHLELSKSISVWFCYLVMGALNNAIPFTLIFWGQAQVGSGLASILNGTTAIFGVLVAGIFLTDEALTRRKIIGVILGFVGVATIMGFQSLQSFDLGNIGQIAILGGAISYAFAGVWAKTYLSEYSSLANAFGMLLGSTLLLFPTVLFFEGVPNFYLSTNVLLSLIGLGFFSTALAYLLYFTILSRAGSANLLLVTLLIPPVTISMTYSILNKTYNGEGLLGFALIASGLLVIDGRVVKSLKNISRTR